MSLIGSISQMYYRQHMHRAVRVRIKAVYRSLFCKMRNSVHELKKWAFADDVPEWRLHIPRTTFPAPVEQALTNHIELMIRAGLRVQVTELTEEMPNGCIGILEIRNAGKLECRAYLTPQEVCTVETRILYLLPHETAEQPVRE